MKARFALSIIALFVLIGYASTAYAEAPQAQVKANDRAVEVEKEVTATEAPATPAQPAVVPTQVPPENYVGYWLKFDLTETSTGSQTLSIMYQDGYGKVAEVAWFCVHGATWNNSKGVYFIFLDRATYYPSAPRGYHSTWFPHNLAWKFFVEIGNEYLHEAPWNPDGPFTCPINDSHGCVNMRPQDFTVLHDGGSYTNPFTGETVNVPPIGVGTPMVVVKSADGCSTLENCMKTFQVSNGYDAFKKYTCALCVDPGPRWTELVAQAPVLGLLKAEK